MTNYAKYVDKKVVLVRNEKGKTLAEEIEGTLISANDSLIMLKPKGKTQATLIEVGEVEKIDYAPEKSKSLTRKALKPVEFGQARAHLLERHGMKLAEVNVLSEKDAFELHKGIDHEKDDLGHKHEDKNDTERAKAVEAA